MPLSYCLLGIHYGMPQANSLHLLKYYFEMYPEDASEVVLSVKDACDIKRGPDDSPARIHSSAVEAVKALGDTKSIDVFECARGDPNFPIETSVKALAELVNEGKIGGVRLSEVKAHHPMSAVEVELIDIAVVAYRPVSRGWLTGDLQKLDDLPQNDFRRILAHSQSDVFDQNFELVEAVEQVSKRKSLTTAQVALGWVCSQGAIPIPGSVKVERVIENCKPVALTNEDMAKV